MTSTTTIKTPNFTDAQVAILHDAAKSSPTGKIDLAIATALAADPRMAAPQGSPPRSVRSILAKINRESIPYERKVAVSKTGEPVTKKTDLVARIAAIVNGNLDGLDKAPKAALVAIARFVEDARESEQDEQDEASVG